MIQRRDRADLALEAVVEALSRDLDGHIASHARIAGAVDLTHAAGADGGDDLVGSQASTGRKRHMGLSDFTPAHSLTVDWA